MSIALKVEKVSKSYRLGEFNTGALSQDLRRWWAIKRGKEDPFSKIGENDRTQADESKLVWSLRDINFEIKRGESVGIIGRNGAGKSTLLKVLSNVTSPTSGKIKINGKVASLLEVGTGFHPELTGSENVFLNGAILGMTKSEIKKRFDSIVDFAGVAKYIDTPVKRYSSGMKVRLGFAVAAHLDSDILIVDEVLAVGDAEFQRKCIGKMKDVTTDGRTVLFVSHNMGSVADLCDSCLILDKGKIEFNGGINEGISEYLSRESNFSGYQDLTNWTGERITNGSTLCFNEVSLKGEDLVNKSLFQYGDSIIFDLTLAGVSSFNAILGVAIRNQLGVLIYHLNNTDQNVKLSIRNGEIKVSIMLEKLELNDGDYFVTLWVGNDANQLLDNPRNCISFTVDSSRFGKIRSQGVVRPEAKWNIQ